MNIFSKFLFWAKNVFFPSSCALCGSLLIYAGEIRTSLCGQCEEAIVTSQGEKCRICGKPLISEMEICLPCRNGQRSYDRIWVVFPYIGKYRKLLAAYKFKNNLTLANYLADKTMEIIKETPELEEAVIVPVPPRPGKIKETGWDQVDFLIKVLKKKSTYNISRCLKRLKSKVQKNLNRTQRLLNLKGRIFLDKPAPKIALVIDDVITTGSTMEVCAQTLKEGGTEKVYGLCLFYD
jgi:ComF family protein